MLQNQAKLKRPSIQKLFEGYYYDNTMEAVQKREGPQSLNDKPKKGNDTAAMTHSTFVGGQEQQSTAQTRG